ncbi:MAG: hypothetical protein GY865_19610 [candidate division Zixibacteria bacterium]|nr:hypothetical protein [candidate division Zixibacteria bacterium]
MESKLINSLLSRKDIILDKWIKSILDGYQFEGARFFTENDNPFHNPVGTKTKSESELILSQILGDMDLAILEKSLEKIIKIRSIQEFSASEAVSFINLLKQVIDDEINSEEFKDIPNSDILNVFARIDKVILMAFDIYMYNRERISQIKINEIKKKYSFVNMDRVPKSKNGKE